jgi:hypothetical protein
VKTEGDREEAYSFVAASGPNASQATDPRDDEYTASSITIGGATTSARIEKYIGKHQTFSATVSFKISPEVQTIKELRFPIAENNLGVTRVARFSDITIAR